MVPQALLQGIQQELTSRSGTVTSILGFSSVGGGCINNGGKLVTSAGTYFLKWNDGKKFPGMFKAEAKGLRTLREANVIDIPEVVFDGTADSLQFLLLHFIHSSTRSTGYWRRLGEKLANLHLNTSAQFGFESENYIGSLRQQNEPCDSWVEFFINKRLEPQLLMGERNGEISASVRKSFDRLYAKLPGLLREEKPSLLHGDLWNGNIMANEEGDPVLIDPAVYYGNREVDLAMTKLFGGFTKEFYDAYHTTFPLESDVETRFELYNLYPLLVHVNLFGGGYLSQVTSILRNFV